MFVACSTRCFSREPLEGALRHVSDLEFNKIDLAIHQEGTHLRPCDVADNLESCLNRVRYASGLTCSALDLDFGPATGSLWNKRFEAACRMAKGLTVAVMAIPAAPAGTPLDDEIERLGALVAHATRLGLVLSVTTKGDALTGDPKAAAALCRAVPGLGITLDPSHFVHLSASAFDDLFPYVQNVHFRDTGKKPGEAQVRIGQGKVEYGRAITMLERNGYARGLTVAIDDALDPPFDVEVEVRKLKLLLESLL